MSSSPVVVVHGNSDTAGLWITTFWRFESNGYPADRLFALDLRYPRASSVWDRPQPGRSTTREVMEQLAAEVARVKSLPGAENVSVAVLCGCVNHGVIVSDKHLVGSAFNGASPFMRDLKSAQPDGRYPGLPGVPTGVGFDGPALAGAANVAIPAIDHRDTGYGIAAFPMPFRAVAGPTVSTSHLAPAPGGSATGTFNHESIGARTWPRPGNHVSVIEITA